MQSSVLLTQAYIYVSNMHSVSLVKVTLSEEQDRKHVLFVIDKFNTNNLHVLVIKSISKPFADALWLTVDATGRKETYFLSTGKQKHWILILRQALESSPAKDEELWKRWASPQTPICKHIYTSWPCCSWSISFIKKKKKKALNAHNHAAWPV